MKLTFEPIFNCVPIELYTAHRVELYIKAYESPLAVPARFERAYPITDNCGLANRCITILPWHQSSGSWSRTKFTWS